jgi:hypothetical protein
LLSDERLGGPNGATVTRGVAARVVRVVRPDAPGRLRKAARPGALTDATGVGEGESPAVVVTGWTPTGWTFAAAAMTFGAEGIGFCAVALGGFVGP